VWAWLPRRNLQNLLIYRLVSILRRESRETLGQDVEAELERANGQATGPRALRPASGADRAPARLVLPRRPLVKTLLGITVCLTVGSAFVQVSRTVLEHGGLGRLGAMLDMTREANLPSWFSGSLFLICAAMAGMIWGVARRRAEPNATYWAGLALLLAAASVDEIAMIHETVGYAIGDGRRGVYTYLLPGTLLVLCVGVMSVRFLAELPQSTKRGLIWAAATFLLGAVALELVEAVFVPAEDSLGSALLGTAQDSFELLGLVILLNTLARHGSEQGYAATISFRS
jgi:hypothetical protein